jgi:hypothetical protein
VALIRRALYGGKSAGRDYWLHMRSCMEFLNFTSCRADADVWMQPATIADGTEYYEYVLLYVDDCLVVSENPEAILRNELGKYFKLKEASIGPPDVYLGGKMWQVVMENGAKAWSFSPFSMFKRLLTMSPSISLQGVKNSHPKLLELPLKTITDQKLTKMMSLVLPILLNISL